MRHIIVLPVLAILGACYNGQEAPPAHAYDYPGQATANCVAAGWQLGTPGYNACAAGEAAKTRP